MMKYSYVIIMLCIYGTASLKAEENSLGDILQQVGQKKSLNKPIPEKKAKEKSHFIFKDTYEMNGIGSKDNDQKKSTSYEYKNKSRFKFKFAPGTDVSNIVAGQGSGSDANGGTGGGGASRGSGQGRGGGGRR